MAPKNIVFDLGGVVVTWRPRDIAARVFPDTAVQSLVLSQVVEHPDWMELDKGTLSRAEAIVRAARRTALPEAEVDRFLRRVPGELVAIPQTVDLMYRLRAQGHRLFCLSNMHRDFIEHLEKTYSFWEVFSGIVISCRLHLCKPEPEVYRYLLETYDLPAEDTVFIDDSDTNLSAAAQFGIQTIKFENPTQCECRLRTLGCLDPLSSL